VKLLRLIEMYLNKIVNLHRVMLFNFVLEYAIRKVKNIKRTWN